MKGILKEPVFKTTAEWLIGVPITKDHSSCCQYLRNMSISFQARTINNSSRHLLACAKGILRKRCRLLQAAVGLCRPSGYAGWPGFFINLRSGPGATKGSLEKLGLAWPVDV